VTNPHLGAHQESLLEKKDISITQEIPKDLGPLF
jgi:hypothetical protein